MNVSVDCQAQQPPQPELSETEGEPNPALNSRIQKGISENEVRLSVFDPDIPPH